MIKDIWFNLPVKDIQQSRRFFTHLGFTFTEHGNSDTSLGLLIGNKNQVVMLFHESTFRQFTSVPVTDTSKGNEVLISIEADSREAVDTMAQKITEAGGSVSGKPAENMGWLYGFNFTDPDGHQWNVLYMDWAKQPK